MQLYPNARLLIAGKEDFARERRKLLAAKIASGTWDGIIVTHSSFERIGMSRPYQERFLREQITEYDQLLCDSAAADTSRAHRNIIKTIEKQKAKREGRLKDLLAAEKKDDGLGFDELGVDHIFIDESHYLKNLETPTKMERVAGIQTSGSERALCLLREPVVEYTVDYHKPVPLLSKTMVERAPLPSRRPTDTAALRLAFEHTLKLRQPRAILIDEAEHIAKAARGSKLLDQLDHVKSLAIMTHTVHVLVGTYDLLVFRNLSAQLARRSVDVHFARYRATTETEVRAFKSVLWALQRNVPLEDEPDLLQHWQYCYERTVGCVGVLKDWLTRGLAEALERGAKTLSRALLARHALSVDRCDHMLTEAMAGEAALTEDGQAVYRLRVRLGLEPGPAQQHGHQQRGHGPGEDSLPSLAGVRRVGHRKPHRDRVRHSATG
jgi:hypothetical protein